MQHSTIQIEVKMNISTKRKNILLPQKWDKKKDESVTAFNLLLSCLIWFPWRRDGENRLLIKWLHYRCACRLRKGQWGYMNTSSQYYKRRAAGAVFSRKGETGHRVKTYSSRSVLKSSTFSYFDGQGVCKHEAVMQPSRRFAFMLIWVNDLIKL